ncbi:hypothetical protein ABTX34_17090 [Streptomyces sp. NPDC096538]|uniref:hypothetical protein n=1 Tax=Streptomyces sp. NPDC096538 TaxID=3155427 RepID=UPI003329FAC2
MTAQIAPAISADDLGEAVGKIAAFAALSLHESYPRLDLDELIETFTRPSATGFLARRFTAGLAQGKTPGEAAGDAGAALYPEVGRRPPRRPRRARRSRPCRLTCRP